MGESARLGILRRWRPSSSLFVLFLYGPLIAILHPVLPGAEGGLTFPITGSRCTGSTNCSSSRRWATSAAASAAPWCSG